MGLANPHCLFPSQAWHASVHKAVAAALLLEPVVREHEAYITLLHELRLLEQHIDGPCRIPPQSLHHPSNPIVVPRSRALPHLLALRHPHGH
jgi:hypothetical protein